MLKTEFYDTRFDGVKLYKTYSDENFKIRQIETGTIYEEAIDVENSGFTYEETDEKIEPAPDLPIDPLPLSEEE